jgi:hypothetical protein
MQRTPYLFKGHVAQQGGPPNRAPNARPALAARRADRNFQIADTQQVLPLPKVALETHALGNLKRRYDASLDVLGSLA